MAGPVLNLNNFLQNRRNRNADMNNNINFNATTKKCLFGKPDPIDIDAVLEEQHKIDRNRIIERFGFDIDIFFDEDQDQENVSPRKEEKCGKNKNREKKCRQDRAFKPYNSQSKITDFCHVKKSNLTIEVPKKPLL